MNKRYEEDAAKSVFGAMVFGAVLGAAAVVFSNKKMRDDLKKAVSGTEENIQKKVDEAKESVSKLKTKSKSALINQLKETQKRLEAAQAKLESEK